MRKKRTMPVFGHAHIMLLSPRMGRCVCVCDLLYIREWDHSRHVNYLLLFCASPTFDAILNPSAFQLFWFRQAALEHVSD